MPFNLLSFSILRPPPEAALVTSGRRFPLRSIAAGNQPLNLLLIKKSLMICKKILYLFFHMLDDFPHFPECRILFGHTWLLTYWLKINCERRVKTQTFRLPGSVSVCNFFDFQHAAPQTSVQHFFQVYFHTLAKRKVKSGDVFLRNFFMRSPDVRN